MDVIGEEVPLLEGGTRSGGSTRTGGVEAAFANLLTFQVVVVMLFGLFTTYQSGNKEFNNTRYGMMLDVSGE
jgi:hypothetical protein